jgi:putative transposase
MIPSRRLPHWHPEGRALFVTWCLYGSLPESRYPPPNHSSAGQAFVWMDRYLDTTREGPMWLRRTDVADVVSARIRAAAEEHHWCDLYAWVVMSNHVHILVRPLIDTGELLRRIKGRTAREANLLIGQTGKPFWQRESYDRWMRNREEMAKTTRYIVNNPVVAGLAATAGEYRWSSAWEGRTGAEAPVAG